MTGDKVRLPAPHITRYALRLALALAVLVGCGGRSGYIAAQQPADGLTITLEQPRALALLQDYELFVTLGGGQYRIRGVFTMEGDWILKIHATVAGKEHVATFGQKVDPL